MNPSKKPILKTCCSTYLDEPMLAHGSPAPCWPIDQGRPRRTGHWPVPTHPGPGTGATGWYAWSANGDELNAEIYVYHLIGRAFGRS